MDIVIDASDLQAKAQKLASKFTDEQGRQQVKWALLSTGRKVKTISAKHAPTYYHTSAGDVRAAVKAPHMEGAMTCIIPLKATKYAVGGNHVSADGEAPGYAPLYGGVKYRVRARIVKGAISTLPPDAFRNSKAASLNGVAFARTAGAGYPPKPHNMPIKPYKALAPSQMPVNRAAGDVINDVEKALDKELTRRLERLVGV